MTPLSVSDVPEVLLVHEFPSGEVRMVPEFPTPTINTLVVELSVVVVVDLLLLQEMMVKLKRRMERIMSRCFNWFPNWLVLGRLDFSIHNLV